MKQLDETNYAWISDEDVERALTFLRDKAPHIADAKAELEKAKHMLKHIKALVMSQHANLAVGAQEREAYASDKYRDQVFKIGEATQRYELLAAQREAAATKITTWQTMNANWRAMKL
jgi:hypothetical protein